MRRSSVYTSAAFHALLVMLAIMGLPFLTHHELDIPQPITVDLVDISKVTQTNRVTPQPAPPKPKEKVEPPKPKPAPVNTAPQPVAPVQEPPKPEEKIVKPTPPTEQVDENAPPKKEKVVKKPEPKKPTPQRDFSSVLKNLDVSNKPPAPPPPGETAPLGEKMTTSEMDALRTQLEQCWDVPIGAKDVENMSVDIAMVINPDRTLREAHIVDAGRYSSDGTFQALADSAMRAVQRCSPFDVPPDKYDTWKTTTVTFNPKDMI